MTIDDDGTLAPRPASSRGHDIAAWRGGWWRFVDTPLAEAVAEVNAYLPAPLEVPPDAGRLRITGTFRIDRPQVFIDSLPKALPVGVVAAGSAPRIELRR